HFIFFFQAEDGIRDFHVTGVQTCALPILYHRAYSGWRRSSTGRSTHRNPTSPSAPWANATSVSRISEKPRINAGNAHASRKVDRSEERRVGKECRSRWSPAD